MIEDIAAYIKRKEQAKEGMVQMLGEARIVEEFSGIYQGLGHELRIAKHALLADFCNTLDFSKQDYYYYRLGLEAMFKLFESCHAEVEAKKILAKQKGKDTT